MSVFRIITTARELIDATADKGARYLIIRNDICDLPTIKLLPYQSIVGEFDGKKLYFADGAEGICLTKGNELKNLNIFTDPDQRAIFQDQSIETLGTHHLTRLNVVGMICFLFSGTTTSGKIDADFVHIANASTTQITERPNRFGTDIALGAFTIWNQGEKPDDNIEVDITHFSCGSESQSINGSGLVIFGHDYMEASVSSNVISCGHMYTKGDLDKGRSDLIFAGLCIGYKTHVKNITNYGRITTYGANETALFNCGTVDKWSITDRIETHGFNSSAFVNGGNIGKILHTHCIETFGIGAKGFYDFAGVIKEIHFNSIITHGDSASAFYSDCYIERVSVSENISTFGSVRKVHIGEEWLDITSNGITLKKGGTIKELKVTGDISTHGIGGIAIYCEGAIEKLLVGGMVFSDGDKSIAMKVYGGFIGSENVKFISEHTEAIKLENGKLNNCRNLTAKGKEYDIVSDQLSTINKVPIKDTDVTKDVFQKGVRIKIEGYIIKDTDIEISQTVLEANNDKANNNDEHKEKHENPFVVKDIQPELTDGTPGGPMVCKAPKDIKPTDKA